MFIKLVFISLAILFAIRFFTFYQNQPKYYNGQYLSFGADLLSQPQISARTQRIMVFLDGGQRVFITVPLFPQFYYGDRIHIVGNLSVKLLNNSDQIYIMNFPKIEAIPHQNILGEGLAITSSIRQKVISVFESTLPQTSSGLLLGIVFGIKEGIPRDFYESLRTSGTLHVTAASGMNVTMVGGFLSALFAFFLRRQIAVLASIAGILFYAVLAGLEPSIVRASIMGTLVFSAQILGRQNLAAYGLFLTGYFMLLFNPNLLFDIGFQLSFLATAGLLFIFPLFNFKNLILGSDLATTISAQLAVLPILLSSFGTYSLWSILANTLVLWSVPFLMILGGLGALAGFIFEPLASFFLYLSLPLLLFFEKIVNVFAGFGGMDLNITSWQFIVGYYSLLMAVILLKRKKV